MEKVYLDQIKQVIERKTGNKYVWVTGETFTQNYDQMILDGGCIALFLESANITGMQVNFVEHKGEYEYEYYTDGEKVEADYVVFLWSSEYFKDENGYYISKDGALRGVLIIDGLDVTVEEVVEG